MKDYRKEVPIWEKSNLTANVKHFFTSLGKKIFTLYGKEFFTLCKKLLTMWWQNHLTDHS